MNEWLQTIKAGDEVVIRCGYGIPVYRIETVERTTEKQIVIGRSRYWRDSGRVVGGSGYETNYLMQPTDRLREEVERKQLIQFLDHAGTSKLSLEQLRAIVAIHKGAASAGEKHG